jgi:hypothetical protein
MPFVGGEMSSEARAGSLGEVARSTAVPHKLPRGRPMACVFACTKRDDARPAGMTKRLWTCEGTG